MSIRNQIHFDRSRPLSLSTYISIPSSQLSGTLPDIYNSLQSPASALNDMVIKRFPADILYRMLYKRPPHSPSPTHS